MRTRTAIALIALAGLTIAACGSDDDGSTDGSATGTVTAEELDGRTFVSTEVTGYDLVEGTEINIIFLADLMSASGGCNSLSGGFEIGEVLTAGPFASTMMACEPALMDQDVWLNDFLSSLPTIALDGETLTLASGDTTMTLDELQPSELVDTTWTVTGIRTCFPLPISTVRSLGTPTMELVVSVRSRSSPRRSTRPVMWSPTSWAGSPRSGRTLPTAWAGKSRERFIVRQWDCPIDRPRRRDGHMSMGVGLTGTFLRNRRSTNDEVAP